MKNSKPRRIFIFTGRIIMTMLGAFITAYGLESVLIPNQVSDGGITGVSIVGSNIFDIKLGYLIAVLNIPFIWLGYKQIGAKFSALSIVGIFSLAIFTSIMHHIPTIIEGDSLLVTIVGGVKIGKHTLNSSHVSISYAVFCLKKKNEMTQVTYTNDSTTAARFAANGTQL